MKKIVQSIYFFRAYKEFRKYFFNGEIDTNTKNILNIDLSHFDSSLVTRTEEMFLGCAQLISLDLSFFNRSSVSNMNKMFSDCASLEYLDISNLDTYNLEVCDEMFNGADIIKYINLYNVKKSNLLKDSISGASNLMTKDNLTVCQKEDFINNENAYYECCNYLIMILKN